MVAVRVDDVAPNGYAVDRATVRQKKTGHPVRFELTEQTRQAIDQYLRLTGRQLWAISVRRPTWTREWPHDPAIRTPANGSPASVSIR